MPLRVGGLRLNPWRNTIGPSRMRGWNHGASRGSKQGRIKDETC
jgi:hypothetical protein